VGVVKVDASSLLHSSTTHDHQSSSMFVSVAVPVPFLDALTYRVPDDVARPARGARVLVPLGARTVTGCVIHADAAAPGDDVACRAIVEVLDDEPFVPEAVLDLALWVADYYAAGPGEAIASAMPPGSWVESERHVAITAQGAAVVAEGARGLPPAQAAALRVLAGLNPSRRLTLRGVRGWNRSPPSCGRSWPKAWPTPRTCCGDAARRSATSASPP
jgi:primosomal protein N'